MKFYGIKRKRNIEKIVFRAIKLKKFISQYTVLNNEKRMRRKFNYKNAFTERNPLRDKSLAIAEGKYLTPFCMVTSDLVLRENIPQMKAGLKKLLKKQYSHKFLGGYTSIEKILKSIENMDNILNSWHESINLGRFDFETVGRLRNKVAYFDVHIKNINSSYLSLEFYIYYTEDYIKEQIEIIDNDYSDTPYISTGFVNNHKRSGGKKAYSVVHYNKAYLKSDLLYENIAIVKWEFYNKIQKYFKTILHQKNVNPPSINMFKTNIDYRETNNSNFWYSIGVAEFRGQFIDEARKIFFMTELSGRYSRNTRTDLMYIVNDQILKKQDGYYSVDFQIVTEFTETLGTNIFIFALLDALNELVSKELISYKLKLNRIKFKKRKLSTLLKHRYYFEKDTDYYRRYVKDDIWENAQDNISRIFNYKTFKRSFDYRILTESTLISKNKIIKQIDDTSADFNDKVTIIQHLTAYKGENRNKRINYLMLAISTATLTFIVFPSSSKFLSEYLIKVWNFIKAFLTSISSII